MGNYVIDAFSIRKAWEVCLANYKPARATLIAHQIVLDSDFLVCNSRRLSKLLGIYTTDFGELAIESLQGKLKNKIGSFSLNLPRGLKNFDKQEIFHCISALIIELWVDNNLISVRQETRRVLSNGKVCSRTIVVLGGREKPLSLLEGYCIDPGELTPTRVGNQRIPDSQRRMFHAMGSMPFVVSDVFTEELLLHFYGLSVEYNAETRYDKRAKRHRRFNSVYLEAARQLKRIPMFFLPVYPDGRGRTYYQASRLYGLRPGGKLAETQFIDRVFGKVLDESAANHIMHIIYVLRRYGKCSVDYALEHFCDDDYEWAKAQNPLDVQKPPVEYSKASHHLYRKAEEDFGNSLLALKCAKALDLYEAGKPCHYLFGKDLTNSGLMMAANCFKSPRMLEGANMMGESHVVDSHMQFGEAHKIGHLSRREIKDIHTPLLHGSSSYTILKKLKEHVPNPDDFDLCDIVRHNVEAYGPEVDNIEIIAKWGQVVVNNYQNILKWKLPDGFVACHQAMMERTPFSVFAASTRVKGKSYKEYKLMATMPIALDAKGRSVFGRDNTTASSSKGVNVKMRGLFANITHSIDAMLLRKIVTHLLDRGEVFLVKHDDYMVSPGCFDDVIEVCQEFFHYLQDNNLYQDALDQISCSLRVPYAAPELLVGDGADKTKESYNFLMV